MTAEQISASYDSSIVVRRWGATVLDFLIFVVLLAVALNQRESRQPFALAGCTVLVLAYYPLLEWRFGATVGKWVCRVRVVDEQGRRPSLGQALVRTLLRLIDVNPLLLGGIPAGVTVLASKSRQRLGDMVARTFVLKLEDLAAVTPFDPTQASDPSAAPGGGQRLPPSARATGTDWLLPTGRSVWAIAAGYLGLFAILLLPAPLALGAGIVGLREVRSSPQLRGRGRAIFGIVMGALFTLLGVVLVVLAIAGES